MAYKRSVFPEGGYDVFKEKYDVSPDKEILVDEYYALWKKVDRTTLEEDRLNQLEVELEPYLYTAEHINQYQDAMSNVQKFFVENTQGYVDGLKVETRGYTDTKKAEMNTYVDVKKTEINQSQTDMLTYADTKKQEVLDYTDLKESEVNTTVLNGQNAINITKDNALISIEQKKENIIEYMDGTTAGALRNDIGVMGDLTTTEKSSLVNAINEVNVDINDKIGILNTKVSPETVLNTTSQNLSGAVNELVEKIGDINLANNIKNFTVSSINQGLGIRATWSNSRDDTTFVQNELFISTSDLTNSDIEHCRSSAIKIYTGKDESFDYDTNKNTLYYLKIFTTYSIGGDIYISEGASTQILTEDKTPPAPVTDIGVKEDDKSVAITYTIPNDDDYVGTRLVYKIDEYPASITDGTIVSNYISDTRITGLTNDVVVYFRLFSYDTSNNYNTDTSQQISATPTEVKIYGIEIDENNSNPLTRVTYTDDAVGFTPCSGNNGAFNWGSWEDIVKNEFMIRSCVLSNPTKGVNYYLDYNDRTKKEDGEPSVLTGTDGDVMTEFGQDIYWKWDTIGSIQKIQVSIKHFEGAVKEAFEVEDGYNQLLYYPLLLTQILFPILFKSTNSQEALGRGYVDGNSGYVNTGGTNAKGFMYGEITGKQQMNFLGIEDFWGNRYQWIDGIVTNASRNLLIGSSGFNDSGSGYTQYPSGVSSDIGGYVDKVQGGNEKGFVLKTVSGSETTHYADYGYLYSSLVAYFGGHLSDGSLAGFALLRLVYSASYAYANFGSRLFCKNNGKLYIGAYLGTTVGGKLRSVSGTTSSNNKAIGVFRTEAKANNN